jgi:hypothetical protein
MTTKFYKVTMLVGYENPHDAPAEGDLEERIRNVVDSPETLNPAGDLYSVEVESFEPE